MIKIFILAQPALVFTPLFVLKADGPLGDFADPSSESQKEAGRTFEIFLT